MSEPNEERKPETPAEPRQDAPTSEIEAPHEMESPRARAAPGRGLSILALLVALGALAASVWQWHEARGRADTVRGELAKKLSEFERYSKEAGDVLRDVRQSSGDTRATISALEARVEESQAKQRALNQIFEDLTKNREDWAFAEVEQSLLIANQQLQLAGNVKAALTALQTADDQLQRMERPQFTNLRRSLAQDIERLKAQTPLDVVGISARLESLIARIDGLPLKPEVRPQSEPPAPADDAADNVWNRFWRDAWSEIKQLIRVQRMEKPDLPLLAPDQRFFLRENVKLRLLAARLALLGRDEKSFRNDLQAARSWLDRYFDTGDSGVTQMAASLAGLEEIKVNVEVPDISGTIEALRSLRAARERVSR